MSANKYPECSSCINLVMDPFQCGGCVSASNYETEEEIEADDISGEIEELSFDEFKDMFGEGR